MSQHDAFENPYVSHHLSPNSCSFSQSTLSPSNEPLQSCNAKGIKKASDTNDSGLQSQSSVLPVPFPFRRSKLSRNECQDEEVVSEALKDAPVFDESPERMPAEGSKQKIIEIETSKKQEDGVRMMAHSNRRAREKVLRCDWERKNAEEVSQEMLLRDESWRVKT